MVYKLVYGVQAGVWGLGWGMVCICMHCTSTRTDSKYTYTCTY